MVIASNENQMVSPVLLGRIHGDTRGFKFEVINEICFNNWHLAFQKIEDLVCVVNSSRNFIPLKELPFLFSFGLQTAIAY